MFLECDVLDTTPPANTISEATQLVRAIAVDKEEELDKTLPYGQSEDNDFENMSEQMPQIPGAIIHS